MKRGTRATSTEPDQFGRSKDRRDPGPGGRHGVSGRSLSRPGKRVRRAFCSLIYFHEADRGGHFAMWEHPELVAPELRAAFKSLQQCRRFE